MPASTFRMLAERPLPDTRRDVVYVLQSEEFGHFKVGHTRDLRARYTTLRSSTPGGVRLVATWHSEVAPAKYIEVDLHARVWPWRTVGEWYRPEAIGVIEGWLVVEPSPPKTPPLMWGHEHRDWLIRRYWPQLEAA
jgi:hypothetical protein